MNIKTIFAQLHDPSTWPPPPERPVQPVDVSEMQPFDISELRPVDISELRPATLEPWTPRDEDVEG